MLIILSVFICIIFVSKVIQTSREAFSLSVVPTYPGGYANITIEKIRETFHLMADTFQLTYMYHDWNAVEISQNNFVWNDVDFSLLMAYEVEIEIVFVISVVEVNIVSIPADIEFNGMFDTPQLQTRLQNFLDLLFAREHADRIKYLYVANEVDTYLVRANSSVAESFKNLVDSVMQWKKQQTFADELQIGVVSTYHDAKREGALNIIEDVCQSCDFIGFSLYPQMMTGTVSIEDIFTEMVQIGDRLSVPIAISESGISSDGLGGTPSKQVEFAKDVFKCLQTNTEKIAYFGFFTLHDLTYEEAAASVGQYGLTDPDFVKWVQYLGIREIEGEGKPIWDTIQSEMENFAIENGGFLISLNYKLLVVFVVLLYMKFLQ